MAAALMVVYLVWSREGRAWVCEPDGWRPRRDAGPEDAGIMYRDWADVAADVRVALAHGRQVRLTRATVSRKTWRHAEASTDAQVRRLRGQV